MNVLVRKIFAPTLLAILISASTAFSCTINSTYVSTTGNDSNSGIISSPFLTIGHAISVSVPGTTINVNNGTYPEIATFSSHSGTTGAGCNIQLQSVPGQTAHIKSVSINNSSYLTIGPNLDISNQTGSKPNGLGIYVTGTSHDNTILSNYIHELCFDGIYMDPTIGGNNLISANRIFRAGHDTGIHIDGNIGGALGSGTTAIDNDISQTQQRPQLLGGIYSVCPAYVSGDDADWFRVFGGGHVIGTPGHGNNLHDIPHGTTANPFDANEPHTDCFQTYFSTLTNTVIEGNTCIGSDSAAHTAWDITGGDYYGNGTLGTVNNVTWRNNVFANLFSGLNLEHDFTNMHVYSNTFDHITNEAIIYNAHIDSGSDVIDNIFYDVGNGGDGSIACIDSTLPTTYTANDMIMRSGGVGTFCNACTCPSNLSIAPGFVNFGNSVGAGADYRLCVATGIPVGCSAASSIRDSGTTIGSFSTDIIGTTRPQNTAWSIGAREEIGSGATPTPTVTPTPTATPTPGGTSIGTTNSLLL